MISEIVDDLLCVGSGARGKYGKMNCFCRAGGCLNNIRQAFFRTKNPRAHPLQIIPEEIELALTQESLQGQLVGRGVVQQIGFAGPLERVVVRLDDTSFEPLQVLLSPEKVRSLAISANSPVWVGLQDYHLLPVNGKH